MATGTADKPRRLENTVRFVCPFCGKKLPDAQAPCCGEAGHAEEVEETITEERDRLRAALVQITKDCTARKAVLIARNALKPNASLSGASRKG